jgi:hypothetical protein
LRLSPESNSPPRSSSSRIAAKATIFARSGLRLLGSDRVLTQFGKAPRGSVLRGPSSAVEPLRSLAAGKLSDIEF